MTKWWSSRAAVPCFGRFAPSHRGVWYQAGHISSLGARLGMAMGGAEECDGKGAWLQKRRPRHHFWFSLTHGMLAAWDLSWHRHFKTPKCLDSKAVAIPFHSNLLRWHKKAPLPWWNQIAPSLCHGSAWAFFPKQSNGVGSNEEYHFT